MLAASATAAPGPACCCWCWPCWLASCASAASMRRPLSSLRVTRSSMAATVCRQDTAEQSRLAVGEAGCVTRHNPPHSLLAFRLLHPWTTWPPAANQPPSSHLCQHVQLLHHVLQHAGQALWQLPCVEGGGFKCRMAAIPQRGSVWRPHFPIRSHRVLQGAHRTNAAGLRLQQRLPVPQRSQLGPAGCAAGGIGSVPQAARPASQSCRRCLLCGAGNLLATSSTCLPPGSCRARASPSSRQAGIKVCAPHHDLLISSR